MKLYKRLLPDSISVGGKGVDLRKMLGLWSDEVSANVKLPEARKLQLRRATLMSLDALRDRIDVRDNIEWSAQPILHLDTDFRKVRFFRWW